MKHFFLTFFAILLVASGTSLQAEPWDKPSEVLKFFQKRSVSLFDTLPEAERLNAVRVLVQGNQAAHTHLILQFAASRFLDAPKQLAVFESLKRGGSIEAIVGDVSADHQRFVLEAAVRFMDLSPGSALETELFERIDGSDDLAAKLAREAVEGSHPWPETVAQRMVSLAFGPSASFSKTHVWAMTQVCRRQKSWQREFSDLLQQIEQASASRKYRLFMEGALNFNAFSAEQKVAFIDKLEEAKHMPQWVAYAIFGGLLESRGTLLLTELASRPRLRKLAARAYFANRRSSAGVHIRNGVDLFPATKGPYSENELALLSSFAEIRLDDQVVVREDILNVLGRIQPSRLVATYKAGDETVRAQLRSIYLGLLSHFEYLGAHSSALAPFFQQIDPDHKLRADKRLDPWRQSIENFFAEDPNEGPVEAPGIALPVGDETILPFLESVAASPDTAGVDIRRRLISISLSAEVSDEVSAQAVKLLTNGPSLETVDATMALLKAVQNSKKPKTLKAATLGLTAVNRNPLNWTPAPHWPQFIAVFNNALRTNKPLTQRGLFRLFGRILEAGYPTEGYDLSRLKKVAQYKGTIDLDARDAIFRFLELPVPARYLAEAPTSIAPEVKGFVRQAVDQILDSDREAKRRIDAAERIASVSLGSELTERVATALLEIEAAGETPPNLKVRCGALVLGFRQRESAAKKL